MLGVLLSIVLFAISIPFKTLELAYKLKEKQEEAKNGTKQSLHDRISISNRKAKQKEKEKSGNVVERFVAKSKKREKAVKAMMRAARLAAHAVGLFLKVLALVVQIIGFFISIIMTFWFVFLIAAVAAAVVIIVPKVTEAVEEEKAAQEEEYNRRLVYNASTGEWVEDTSGESSDNGNPEGTSGSGEGGSGTGGSGGGSGGGGSGGGGSVVVGNGDAIVSQATMLMDAMILYGAENYEPIPAHGNCNTNDEYGIWYHGPSCHMSKLGVSDSSDHYYNIETSFGVNYHIRPDCSGFASAVMGLLIQDSTAPNKNSSSIADYARAHSDKFEVYVLDGTTYNGTTFPLQAGDICVMPGTHVELVISCTRDGNGVLHGTRMGLGGCRTNANKIKDITNGTCGSTYVQLYGGFTPSIIIRYKGGS